MVILSKTWAVDGYARLCHLTCTTSRYGGATRFITFILSNYNPHNNYCDDCLKKVPKTIIEKVKFLYGHLR